MPIRFKNTDHNDSRNAGKNPLKFIEIGDSVTKNLSVYEYEDTLIAVDFGIGFPEGDSFGVDFLIPDYTYLVENSHKLKALFITHAHADHFAAVPYLLQELNVPIYANKITTEYIKELLDEKQFKSLKEQVSFHLFDETSKEVDLGAFKVSAFGVNHSVPNALGLVIKTPEGTILHMADFKIDNHAVLDKPIDLDTIEKYGQEGVLCLVSDCLGARTAGFIESESTLNNTFGDLFKELEGKQIFITTISSNIARMYQIIDAAIKYDRKVVPTGRSIDQSIKIARNLGYLPFADDVFVSVKQAQDFKEDHLVYLIAGCFGQSGSSLDRLSRGEHQDVSLQPGGYVIFSSEPNPPGVDLDVERVISDIILREGEVLDHHNREHLHISGHGHKGDLSKIATLANPKYFIPIGGAPVHLHAYKNMIGEVGLNKNNVFALQEGDCVEFLNGNARLGARLEVNDRYIDGIDISPVVIRDRVLLSTDGVFVVVVPISREEKKIINNGIDMVTRGFVYVKESKALLGQTKDIIQKVLDKTGPNADNWGDIKTKIEKDVHKYLYKQTRRNPLVIVHSIFV